MFVLFKTIARTLILPPCGPLLLALVGWVLAARGRRIGHVLLAVGLVSLWLVSTPFVADGLTRLVELYPPLDLSKPVRAQAIVILGGGGLRSTAPEYGGPATERDLLERLTYGAYVARRTSLPVLVSGTPREGIAMRTSLSRDFGITTRWVEGHSRDTFENAQFSARILHADGVRRIILVTSSTHMWRATHEFESAGFEVVPAPVSVWTVREISPIRFIPTAVGLMRSETALYELMGEPVRQTLAALHLRRHAA
jgi:uncharacterized SAM-binding protein YcdF (DUF218 family)